MLTSLAIGTEVRPAYRSFRVAVRRVERIAPSFVRVTFTGDDLGLFGTAGLDQRVKVVLPLPDDLVATGDGFASFPTDDDWYTRWRELPEARRNTFRTYTVRAVRPADREVDIDFVLHGETGPASRWVARAHAGDEAVLIGPDERSTGRELGIDWRPGEVDTVLLAGDETAAPAICSILGALPRTATGCAFIEVPTAGDVLDVDAPAGVSVRWLPRGERATHGDRLVPAVRDGVARLMIAPGETVDLDAEDGADDPDADLLWDVPEGRSLDGGVYAWVAGEASVVKSIRRYLVSEAGLDRRRVAFMGYWRLGRAELD
ncbi:siderophore-interacting protein [Agromyces intestinalis]|uniref:Siderophore-interacting protein n=1 Tax=Agromyces intestinalis TaxID=2592652 RepID=A0A5C1YFC9_9MICO|nr:siderophore-interacting protein [Agromyces intestinalis]QEO13462.1 siderophore-interacting protein [Agromyces intestinalis]